ncbi:hypothetical protein [Rhizobium sp. SGZ-381]|uniref:hypothetical protein n=1 Tax=Rhizobium sp. SGZ-381 TaxID=3342800 RepID=UPI003671BFE6
MAKRPARTQGGEKAIRAIFEDAKAELAEITPISDPDPNYARNGIKPGKWDGAPHDRMPPDCPITVLGSKGEVTYVISAIGELHAVTRWDLSTLIKLFAPFTNYLFWAWPAYGKAKEDPETGDVLPPKVERIQRDQAMTAILGEAGRKGIFDPNSNVRGRGGWKAQDKFIWHSGKWLWSVSTRTDGENKATGWQLQQARPGEYDGYFYAQDADTLHPWREHVGVYDSPAHEILQELKKWKWERPYLDPLLYLGWAGTGFLSGALDVRPILFTMGGAGTGKSTLHNILRELYGSALYSTANTTAAGIYQNIRQDSRPVAVDEFERKANSNKEGAIIELARQAYSGAKGYRGGANGEGSEFELRSPFCFSAILHPHLGVQDRTRMIILNLSPLDKSGAVPPIIKAEWGRMLLRQMMDGFHDFYWHILPRWKSILADPRLGFDARAIDTYGTVLACAELMVGEQGMIDAGLHADPTAAASGELRLDHDMLIETLQEATAAERADQMPKWQEVIETILGAKLDAYKSGERMTVGGVLEALEDKNRSDMQIADARERLALLGLGLREQGRPCKGYALAIPHSDDNLNRLFADKEFHHGGWTLALGQAPETIVPRALTPAEKTVKINRAAKVCKLVDLAGYDEWCDE